MNGLVEGALDSALISLSALPGGTALTHQSDRPSLCKKGAGGCVVLMAAERVCALSRMSVPVAVSATGYHIMRVLFYFQ